MHVLATPDRPKRHSPTTSNGLEQLNTLPQLRRNCVSNGGITTNATTTTSSILTDFDFLHCWKQKLIIYKLNRQLKTSLHYRVKPKSVKCCNCSDINPWWQSWQFHQLCLNSLNTEKILYLLFTALIQQRVFEELLDIWHSNWRGESSSSRGRWICT